MKLAYGIREIFRKREVPVFLDYAWNRQKGLKMSPHTYWTGAGSTSTMGGREGLVKI